MMPRNVLFTRLQPFKGRFQPFSATALAELFSQGGVASQQEVYLTQQTVTDADVRQT